MTGPEPPTIRGDGSDDDQPAIEAMREAKPVLRVDGRVFECPYFGIWEDENDG